MQADPILQKSTHVGRTEPHKLDETAALEAVAAGSAVGFANTPQAATEAVDGDGSAAVSRTSSRVLSGSDGPPLGPWASTHDRRRAR
jgi:hypothetical protein